MGSESTLSVIKAFDLISSTTILGAFYGIIFVLYCLCARSLYPNLRQPEKRLQARRSLGSISFLFVCATGSVALNAWLMQLVYINHADFPGGPFKYELLSHSTFGSYYTVSGIIDMIIETSTMVIQLRRLWIIWGRSRYAMAVTILPVLLLLCYVALTIQIYTVNGIVPIDQLFISRMTVDALVTIAYAAPSGFTILVTGLIAGRLLLERRWNRKIMGTSDSDIPYLSIVAMLVESYTLEAAWSLATGITFGLLDPSELMFATNDPIVKIVAYFLIVYRVETGRGWTQETGEKLTSLQWNCGGRTTTDDTSGVRSRVPLASTAIAAVDSLPTTHSNSAI